MTFLETPQPVEHASTLEAALLETAAQRVAARLHELFPDREQDERERLRRRLATLVVAIRRIAAGTSASVTSAPTSVDDDVLLRRLEHEILWQASNAAEEGASVVLLRACSSYRRTHAAAFPVEEEAEDLRASMLGPNAFELLVEVAHDFRSPLTSILFLSETLRDGHSGPVSDLQRSQLGLVYSAAFGLASVASDVVDLARRGKDLVADEPEPYAFAEVFRNVERMVLPLVQEKGLELRIVAPEHGGAEGHPHALTRVLLNLATNALKFTDQGLVELGVRWVTHGRIEYYVQDTGRGIPVERQAELFKPFKKRQGRGERGHFFSGSGVGLSIARRLVEAMGSALEYTTSDSEGTRFSFVLQVPQRR